MDAIHTAVNRFLDLESQLKMDFLSTDPAAYNATLEAFTSLHRHPAVRCIYAPRLEAWTGERARKYAAMAPTAMRRKCCKISTYDSTGYGQLYAVYLSSLLPPLSPRVDYQKCYWWSMDDTGPGIVADYTWPMGEEAEKTWFFNSGDATIGFDQLNSPVDIERLLPPVSDPAALTDYRADK